MSASSYCESPARSLRKGFRLGLGRTSRVWCRTSGRSHVHTPLPTRFARRILCFALNASPSLGTCFAATILNLWRHGYPHRSKIFFQFVWSYYSQHVQAFQCNICPAVYIVLTFQFPILIWVLGVISGLFSSWAPSRLWPKGAILCLPKQGTTLAPREGCLRMVSVICFVLRGRVIGLPPNPQPGGPGAVLCLVSTPRQIRHG